MRTVSTTDFVRKSLAKIPEGRVFGYDAFKQKDRNEVTVAKALSRLQNRGEIIRLTKGKYYKPRKSVFGELRPAESEIITALTITGNRIVGYITGVTVFNNLGLTSQISNVILIARNNIQAPKQLNGYKIKYVKRNFEINEPDVLLLQMLDAIKQIRNIPDANINQSVKILSKLITALPKIKIKRLMVLSRYYNPATRALLGAMIENNLPDITTERIKKTLNSFTNYEFNIDLKTLPNKINWNIE